jgi:hypothetical protein
LLAVERGVRDAVAREETYGSLGIGGAQRGEVSVDEFICWGRRHPLILS